jgi:hypothetical protein
VQRPWFGERAVELTGLIYGKILGVLDGMREVANAECGYFCAVGGWL